MSKEILRRARNLRLAVFDVDGVLTDGRLYLLPGGQEMKVFDARDGLGLKLLMRSGVEVAIISGRSSSVVEERFRSLGINYLYQGHEDKLPVFERLLEKTSTPAAQAAFTGDDILDIPVLVAAGLGFSVADAHPEVRKKADHVTVNGGGRGAVREICDLLIGARQEDGS